MVTLFPAHLKKKRKKEEFSNSKELFPTSRRTEQYFFLSSMSSIVIFYDRVGLTAALQARTVLLAITTRKDFGDLLVTCSLCFQLIQQSCIKLHSYYYKMLSEISFLCNTINALLFSFVKKLQIINLVIIITKNFVFNGQV